MKKNLTHMRIPEWLLTAIRPYKATYARAADYTAIQFLLDSYELKVSPRGTDSVLSKANRVAGSLSEQTPTLKTASKKPTNKKKVKIHG